MIDTLMTNTTNIVIIGQRLNVNSDGVYGVIILLVIYAIVFFIGLNSGSRAAFMTSSIVGGLAAIILRLMEWMTNDAILFFSIVLLALAGLMLIKKPNEQ